MSFAVIQTGGKQYKVKASDILKIEKLKNSKPESKVEFNEVLAYGDDKTLEIDLGDNNKTLSKRDELLPKLSEVDNNLLPQFN